GRRPGRAAAGPAGRGPGGPYRRRAAAGVGPGARPGPRPGAGRVGRGGADGGPRPPGPPPPRGGGGGGRGGARARAARGGGAVEDNRAATQLYRIAQEAVANALRHGRCGRVVIGLEGNGRSVTLRVRDDGVGLPEGAEGRGMGLKIMRYRAGLINARLSV